MIFKTDETWLKEFTGRYGKKKRIDEISKRDLKKWTALTDSTDGAYIGAYMSPDRWNSSADSLRTALDVISEFVPERLAGTETVQQSITALRQAILHILPKPPRLK